MKKIILSVLSLFILLSTHAQDPNYSGKAKVQVKSFWSHIEKLKAGEATASTLRNADRAITMVKENDPAYNTSDMEAALKPWKEKAQKENDTKEANASKKDEERNYYSDVWAKVISVYSSGNNIEPGISGKTYLDRVNKIDLAAYQQKRAAAGEIAAGSYIAKIDAMLADYDAYLIRSDRLKWNVIQPMTESRRIENPQEKIEVLQDAKYECEAVLIMSPNNVAFKQKLADLNKLLGSAEGESAKYFTSEFHREHVNSIVWSSKPLIVGKEKEMKSFISNSFKTGDYIYGTVYLGMNAKDVMNGNENLRIVIKVDNGTAIWGGDLSYIIVPLPTQNKSYIQFALIPDAQWFKDNYTAYLQDGNWTISYLMDELARSGDISHHLTCQLKFPSAKLGDIKSEFSLDLSNGLTEIKSLSTNLHNELMASRRLPKAGMSNPSLEANMVEVMNKLGWNEKFSKAIITSSTWAVKKNELTGAILYRYVGVIGITKDNDGKCFYQDFTFRQDYAGGGNYESGVKFNSYGPKREIGCDKAK